MADKKTKKTTGLKLNIKSMKKLTKKELDKAIGGRSTQTGGCFPTHHCSY